MRHLSGKKAAETVVKKNRAKGIQRKCNKCDQLWWAPNKYTWTCPDCKHNRQNFPTGAEWWGRTI
jgi:Zn finger protein HypA/HybF involved in hydrogenase expression